MCAQAQSEVAQLQSQLQDAATQQEALQQALHDMQSTIAVLREQIQQQAEASAVDADAYLQPGSQQRASSTSQLSSQATHASTLVRALQQQVEDLKDISACLSDSRQQHMKHQPSRSMSLDRSNTHIRACKDVAGAHGGMTGSPRGLSETGQRHDCMMPPPAPRSMPNRRLPMSAYASPASKPASHHTSAIKAHQPTRQSVAMSAADTAAGDKCWCGRPKQLAGSTVGTPSNRGIARRTHETSSAVGQQRVTLHTPSRFPDR